MFGFAALLFGGDFKDVFSWPFGGTFLGFSFALLGAFLFLPQIAGSYRGSYFSMTGLLIPEIAKWS